MVATHCVHDEVITPIDDGTSDTLGTCKKCGQEKRYPWDGGQKPIIVKEGFDSAMHPAKESGPWSPLWVTLTRPRKGEWFRKHLDQILADYSREGFCGTRLIWGMPPSTLSGLVSRSRSFKPQRKPKSDGEVPLRSPQEIQAAIDAMELVRDMLKPADGICIASNLDGLIRTLQWVLGDKH